MAHENETRQPKHALSAVLRDEADTAMREPASSDLLIAEPIDLSALAAAGPDAPEVDLDAAPPPAAAVDVLTPSENGDARVTLLDGEDEEGREALVRALRRYAARTGLAEILTREEILVEDPEAPEAVSSDGAVCAGLTVARYACELRFTDPEQALPPLVTALQALRDSGAALELALRGPDGRFRAIASLQAH